MSIQIYSADFKRAGTCMKKQTKDFLREHGMNPAHLIPSRGGICGDTLRATGHAIAVRIVDLAEEARRGEK